MIRWFREWRDARRERIIFEALWALAEMEHAQTEQDCSICEGDLQACICDDGTDCD
jgi:hypothetical protein